MTILDEEYGEDREESGYGGYVLVLEVDCEKSKLKEVGIDVETEIPEYLDVIKCEDGRFFTSSLVLIGSDFGIVVISQGELPICKKWSEYM